MRPLVNHPGKWLHASAADALARLEAAHGRIRVTSAGRTASEQQQLITRWDRGGSANRPPYLYPPARPAATSKHVIDGGRAIDTPSIAHMLAHGRAFGWIQPDPSDPVHFEYRADLDQRGAPPFPLPAGAYFGPKSGPKRSVSGYYSHREDLRRWQLQMRARGWQIEPDGLYGRQTGNVAAAFQAEKGLTVDRLIGPATWAAAWTAPVT